MLLSLLGHAAKILPNEHHELISKKKKINLNY